MKESQFGKGAVIGRPDPRDYQLAEIAHGAEPFNWSVGFDIEQELSNVLGIPNFKLPVKNQNGSGSCGGQAWSQYAGVLEAFASGTFEERSAKFVYAQTFYPNGGGSTAPDNANVLMRQGVSYETDCPSYDKGNPPAESFMVRPQDISDIARINAKGAITPAYAFGVANIDEIAKNVRDFHGCVIGIAGEDNGTWLGEYPVAPKKVAWRHWVYVGKVKVINGKKMLGFVNSWGITTGNKGWQWIGEEFMPHTFCVITHILPVSPPPVSFKHNWKYNLEYGAKGGDVVALQKAMQLMGYFPKGLPCTGAYLDITRRSVLAMQLGERIGTQKEILALNGKLVGVKTRNFLNTKFS
jgi:hypothetical protein